MYFILYSQWRHRGESSALLYELILKILAIFFNVIFFTCSPEGFYKMHMGLSLTIPSSILSRWDRDLLSMQYTARNIKLILYWHRNFSQFFVYFLLCIKCTIPINHFTKAQNKLTPLYRHIIYEMWKLNVEVKRIEFTTSVFY